MQALGPDDAQTFMSRSFLFVPADSEKKLARSRDAGADALILDLEDSVHKNAKRQARQLAREFLGDKLNAEIWVRINPLDSADALDDLREIISAAPFGIVLPKSCGARDVNQLSMLLDVLEQESELAPGETAILPIATERPEALFHLHEYAQASPRLQGLTWGAEDLSSAVGAMTNRDEAGNWLPPYQLARSLSLFAAASAGVPAIDTVFTDYHDIEGLAQYASASRRDGFAGMLAIHPAQIPVINDAFTPSATEIDRAAKIVELFAREPGAGVLGMDGEMIDRPHLLLAKRILEIAARSDRNQQ
jgi:citrate lyase subunit beta/citryl-CoA lyase